MRVLVADGLAEEGLSRLRQAAEVLVRAALEEDDLGALLPDIDALIVRSRTRVSSGPLDRATRLRVIARAGVGVDNIDVNAATRRGILVLNAPEASTTAAAEHTMAMLLVNMHVGRREAGGTAVMVLTLDGSASDTALRELQTADGMTRVSAVHLRHPVDARDPETAAQEG